MGIIIQFLHLKSLNTPNLCMHQMRHLLHPNSGLDVELCLVSHFLGLAEIQRRVEKSVLSGLTLSTFIPTCAYAAKYKMTSILRGCFIWLKRFDSLSLLTSSQGFIVCRKKDVSKQTLDSLFLDPSTQRLGYGEDELDISLFERRGLKGV